MPTAHIESKKEDIAKIVIMPGDPLRAKMIAETYLDNYKLVNAVRNMYGYTGYYKNTRITVFASGMGIPSVCIYAYELYKFYDVEKIIRIGTCGSNKEDIKLLDVILSTSAYSLSTFAKLFSNSNANEFNSSKLLNDNILKVAKKNNYNLKVGSIITSDVFDVYTNFDEYIKNFPKDRNFLGVEMEAFGLFYLANLLKKDATALLTVVDSHYDKHEISSNDRQNKLHDMIKIALESVVEE